MEASVSQEMRISHLAAAILVVYLSSEYSMIVGVYICDAPIQTRAVLNTKQLQASFFLVDTVEAFVLQKMRIIHLAAAILMVYLPCDSTTILSSLHLWRRK